MKKSSKSYGNLFTSPAIIPARLYSFSSETLRRLKVENATSYSDYVNQLTPAKDNLAKILGDLKKGLGERKSSIDQRNLLMQKIKNTMSEKEGLIRGLLGDFNPAAYARFYPNGISEYTQANIMEMDLLTKRITSETTNNADKLGTELTAQLLSFEPAWLAAVAEVSKANKTLADNRSARTAAVNTLSYILSDLVRSVGKSANDEAQYKVFFDFNLLYAPARDGKKAAPVVEMSTEQKPAANA